MAIGSKPKSQLVHQFSQPKLAGIRIIGTGMCAPANVVKNEALSELGYDSDWIVQRTGIEARCHVVPGQATSDIAYKAAKQCLERANMRPEDVDLIIVATMSPDHSTPSTSCILQAKLGSQAPAMDLNAACSGFMYALVTASQFVKTGCCKNALVVAQKSCRPWWTRKTKKLSRCLVTSRGAALIAADPEHDPEMPSGILAHRIAAEGILGDKLLVPGGGSRLPISQQVLDDRSHYLQMDGRCVFKWAVRLIPDIVEEMLVKSGMQLDDIDLIIFHQANRRILDAAVEIIGADPEKVFVNLDKYGNTSAASIPISLHEAVIQGRVKPGSTILMAGFGSGLTWGACIFRW